MKKNVLLITSLLCILIALWYSVKESKEIQTNLTKNNETKTTEVEQTETVEITRSTMLPKTSSLNLIIYQTPSKYTYENLAQDINQLKSVYGDELLVKSLCDTADGRKVYDVILGNPYGKQQILIFGAMHAREYITTQIVMRQLCDSIDAINKYGGEYRGIPLRDILSEVTVHFVPMNNPDGVAISQKGIEAINNAKLRNQILSMGTDDYQQWKANGTGVDLNRNFDAGWIEYKGSSQPSTERYKGRFPGSEPESAALIALTQDYNIQRAISYHTCGALIYWYYKQTGQVLKESKSFAELISQETGYPLDSDYTTVDAAGYKDWAVYRKGVPSLTIEVGAENGNSIVNPVPIERWNNIWERNKNVLYATIYDLLKGGR